MFDYKIQVNTIHTILKYGDYYDLGLAYGALLKSSSHWQLKENLKINSSWPDYSIFKILLIAIDWNF